MSMSEGTGAGSAHREEVDGVMSMSEGGGDVGVAVSWVGVVLGVVGGAVFVGIGVDNCSGRC